MSKCLLALAQAFVTRAAYGASAASTRRLVLRPQSCASAKLSQDTVRRTKSPGKRDAACIPMRQVPDRKHIYADMAKSVLAGSSQCRGSAASIPFPLTMMAPLLALIHRSRIFFDDLPNGSIGAAKHRAHGEVLNEITSRNATPLLSAELPLSIWRLADGEIGRVVRHSGRDSFLTVRRMR